MKKYLFLLWLVPGLFASNTAFGAYLEVKENVDPTSPSPEKLYDPDAKKLCKPNRATIKGNLDRVKHLLEQGAEVDFKDITYRQTALIMAAQKGYVEIVAHLIRAKAAINYQDMYGNSALHTAAYDDQDKVVWWLLITGARSDLKNKMGDTALHHMLDGFKGAKDNNYALYPKLEQTRNIIQLLIAHGASVTALGFGDRTPYERVCFFDIPVYDLFVELGAQKPGGCKHKQVLPGQCCICFEPVKPKRDILPRCHLECLLKKFI